MDVFQVHTKFHTKYPNLENPATQGCKVMCKLTIFFGNQYALWLPIGPYNEKCVESLYKISIGKRENKKVGHT